MTPPIEQDLFGDVPDHGATAAPPPERWPERLATLTDLVTDALAGSVGAAEARRLGCAVVTRLAREFGGSMWYVPKVDALERTLRNLEIWAAHDGTVDGPRGIRALARHYRLSDQQVWAVLRSERALHRRRVQPELPGFGDLISECGAGPRGGK